MMLSKWWQGLLMMVLAVTLTLGVASTAYAQGRDTGLAVVHAADPDGAPLPGVMVVMTGPVGRQTQYTGVDGSARFPGLYPGDGYAAVFTLDGFTTIIRDGLTVTANRVIEFTVEMALATVSETITVTGASPLVDVKSTSISGLITSELIEMAPSASGLWAGVLDHVPGLVSSFDVGGGDAGQQTGMRAWGSEGRNGSYNVNGGDTTDPAAVGASSSYFAIGAFEEVSVSMAAQDIEIKTPGININMVVKSGSNDWHGGAKFFYENEGMVSNNVDAELEAAGITEGTPNVKLSDLDIQGGGPIVRDRAWFFIDYWDFEIRKVILGLEEHDATELTDWTMNFNGQINDNNKISGRYIKTVKFRNNRGASQTRPYLGRVQDSGSHIPQLQWQSVINQNIFSDIRFSTVRSNFPLARRFEPGSVTVPEATPTSVGATYDYGISNYVVRNSLPTSEFFDERDTDSLNGTVSWYITGEKTSHDLKFGGNYQWINYFSPFNYPLGYRRYVDSREDPLGNPNWEVGVPQDVTLYNAPIARIDGGTMNCFVLNDCWKPDNAYNLRGRAKGLFLQDTITIANRFTVALAARWDQAYNWNPAQNRLDSPYCGVQIGDGTDQADARPDQFCGGSFPEQDIAFKWTDVTFRGGLIWDVTGDGTWAAKVNYAIYPEALGISYGGVTNVNDTAREFWVWNDPNGDGVYQVGEETTYLDGDYPGAGRALDPELQAPLTGEWIVGVEHEIFGNILLSATGIFRGRRDDVGTVSLGRPFGPMFASERCRQECTPTLPYGQDPYVLLSGPTTIDPGDDGMFGTADDGGPVPLWARDPGRGPSDQLTTNPNTFGFETNRYYKGVSFVMSKRWSNNWQMLGSWDIGKSEFSGSSTTASGLYNGRRQLSSDDRTHIIKLTTNYLIAEPIGINLGLFIRAQSGQRETVDFSYPRALMTAPANGSPFSSGQGNQSRTLQVGGESTSCPGCIRPDREPFTTLVDIRAEKQVTIGRYGVLHFYFDVFNAFNANTVTNVESTLGSQYGRIRDILSPRVIRIGGAWDF